MLYIIKDLIGSSQKGLVAKLAYIPFMLRDVFYCKLIGLQHHKTWRFYGLPKIRLRSKQSIRIGTNFRAISRQSSNTIGLIQPVIIRTLTPNAKIEIGDDFGISGSTLAAKLSIRIGNNVLIGSGCLVTDSDAHAATAEARLRGVPPSMAPVFLEDGVFIGARSIILKGVRVGRGSVVGAGSVVSKDVPAGVIVAGNPAKVIRAL
jgi:acetyltransferase-like isoleucine patch superfamily enzyme